MKALLLFMWKAINNHEKNCKLIKDHCHSSTSLITPTGTHDMYGASLFSEQFLIMWQKDNFTEYSVANTLIELHDGSQILKRIINQDSVTNSSDIFKRSERSVSTLGHSLQKSFNGTFNNFNNMNSNDMLPLTMNDLDIPLNSIDNSSHNNNNTMNFNNTETKIIRSHQLEILFRMKPELAEYIYLEIENMKEKELLTKDRMTAD